MKRVQLLLLIATLAALAGLAYALDPPHDFTNTIDCTNCHTPHKAAGGAITKVAGNANLCESCHVIGGLANNKPFVETDQALPAPGLPSGTNPSGTSHRWDSAASGHVTVGGTNTSTGTLQSGGTFTGRYAKTYTISITTEGDTGLARLSWSAVRWPGDTGGGSGSNVATGSSVALNDGITVTFTNGVTSPSFKLNDSWKVYVRTDLNQPADTAMAARISDGKIMCSTCHNQHSQAAIPFDPSAPAYTGSGTGEGRHYQRINNDTNQMCLDCHSARNKGSLSGQTGNLTHPVGLARSIWNGLFKARADITLPLDKGTDLVAGTTDDRIQCLSCHQPHFGPSNDGTLLRMSNVASLCTDCHTLADTAAGAHFNTTTGVLWPGGQYGSTFPAVDSTKRGFCTNCHQPHGWPDGGNPSQDYAKLLVDKQENLCYTCHDGTVTTTANVYAQFNGSTNFRITPGGVAINQRHDVSDADQLFSGAVVECTNCHDPHVANGTHKLINPDTGAVYTQTYSTANCYAGDCANRAYRSASTDQDPTFSSTPTWTVGAAACQGSCADTATSGGSYTAQGDEGVLTQIVYTVTVSTGGAPGGPPTYSIGGATCTDVTNSPPCLDDTATSGGTYNDQGDPGNNTYTVSVATPGQTGSATVAISSTREGSLGTKTWNSGTPIALSARGVTITIIDPDATAKNRTLVSGERWQIVVTQTSPGGQAKITVTSTNSLDNRGPTNVTAFGTPVAVGTRGVTITFTDGGDGVLTQNNTWNIAVDKSTSSPEPDMVNFCLTCHDGTPPAGVTMTSGLTDIASAYLASNGDKMGRAPGRTGTTIGNGYLKFPWHVQPASCSASGGWTGCEDPNFPYAALQCTTCHDGHGSDSIFHLRTQIIVGGVQMKAGGDNPNSQFGPGSFARWGSTTYSLPCQGGNGNPNCASNPTGAQQNLYYGAWCSFCHEMSSHPAKSETIACASSHSHGVGNF